MLLLSGVGWLIVTTVSGPDDGQFKPLDLGDGLEVPGNARHKVERGRPPPSEKDHSHRGAVAVDRHPADVTNRHHMLVWLAVPTQHLGDRVPHHPIVELAGP